jgi:hypothetical protein
VNQPIETLDLLSSQKRAILPYSTGRIIGIILAVEWSNDLQFKKKGGERR